MKQTNQLWPDVNRIDFQNYIDSYPDLQAVFGKNTHAAKIHWVNNGRHEGRHIKLNDINYTQLKNFVIDNHHSLESDFSVNLLTTLYNESVDKRLEEYLLTLEINLQNPQIARVYVLWDQLTGSINNMLPSHEKLTVINHSGRPSFKFLFDFCKHTSPGTWCICNGDIVMTNDVQKLKDLDMNNKILALTRWEFVSETEISPMYVNGAPNKFSQDTWIIKPTDNIIVDELEDIYMGRVNCDCNLTGVFKKHNIKIYNPCVDVKTLHVHMQNNRRQDYSNANVNYVECCSLQDIY